jgi:hypothetical protein
MPDPLPGMPLRVGDPGVFVCGPQDIAPWESARPGSLTQQGRLSNTSNDVPAAPRPAPAWLVLALCPHCNPRTGGYCHDHNATNWWLTTMSSAPRKGGERKSARPES